MTTINDILIKPSKNDHASKVICAADHITQKEPMKTEITLEYVGMFCLTLFIILVVKLQNHKVCIRVRLIIGLQTSSCTHSHSQGFFFYCSYTLVMAETSVYVSSGLV